MKSFKFIFVLFFGFTFADCLDLTTESDCIAVDHCEWHADESVCEDEGHDDGHDDDHSDHEHCEDFTTESDCMAGEHCEWHADENACEDEGHDDGHDDDHSDHEHCEDFTTESDCMAGEHCEWHADESACEDEGHDDDHSDHEHCEDFTTESDCMAGEHCEWHADESACEDEGHDDDHDGHDHGECDADDHVDVDGIILEYNGVEIYSQFQGFINGDVELHVNDTKELSVHFLDSNGNEIVIEDEHDAECYPLSFDIADENIISINSDSHDDDDHDDHDDDHDGHDHGDDHSDDHDDDHDEHSSEGHQAFELTGLSAGATTFAISIMHDGHADYTSMPIYVEVEEEEHCEDFTTESDCMAGEHCEWHADENACEDEGHDDGHDDDHSDHEHCEDFTTESDCMAGEHCEWHADENACEDEGHDDDHDGHDHGECDADDHVDVDGIILEYNGVEIYSQFQGFINGGVELHVNDTKELSVHFLDSNGNEIVIEDEHDAECYPLSFDIEDENIISINSDSHDDDHDDHDDDHDEHCEDFTTESDCMAGEHCEWHADENACEDEGHDEDHDDDHSAEGHQVFDLAGLSVGATTFVISIMHEGHADYTTMPIYVSVVEEEDDCTVDGDVNDDGSTNILDCVSMVQYILSNISYSDEQICTADLNGDDSVNVLDIIQIVFFVLDAPKAAEASSATFTKTASSMFMKSNGVVGAVEMTLFHEIGFRLELSDKALIADYKTDGESTKIIVIMPDEVLFTTSDEYIVEEIVAATTSGYIRTSINEPASISLGNAYPNPFNPSTSFKLNIGKSAYVSVKVFNIAGEFVDVIHEGSLSQGAHSMTWNGHNVSSGVYFVQAVSGDMILTQKLMLVK